jgi:hypothetical protein
MIKMNLVASCALVVGATLWSSCSEEEKSGASSGMLVASVDGSSWKSNEIAVMIMDGSISIAAESSDGSQLVIYLDGDQTGIYEIEGLSDDVDNSISFTPKNADLSNPTYTSAYFEEAEVVGEVNVTEIDEENKTISGTFKTKVYRYVPNEELLEIKSGSFKNLPYSEDSTPVPGNSFTAKVDGSTYTPSTVSGIEGFGKIMISSSTSGGGKTVSVTVAATTETGTFDLEGMGSEYTGLYSVANNSYESVSGSVVITKHDKSKNRIEGTFSFTAEIFPTGGSPVEITNGSFAITYH